MNKLILNYDNLSIEYKYIMCSDKLLETENDLLNYDKLVLDEWYTIQYLNMFSDQIDYYNYMLSLPKYENLMNTKKILEFEIIQLNKLYEKESKIKPMQESISLHMEQPEH